MMMQQARSPLLFVTQHFPPEEIGSAPYCADLARSFKAAGHRVEVLTGLPHYPDPSAFSGISAGRSRFEGIPVLRLNAAGPRKRSSLRRIVAEGWFFVLGIAALLLGRVKRSELVLSLGPSIFAVAVGCLAKRRKGRHVVILHDIQSGLAKGLNMVSSGFVLSAIRWLEKFVLNRADLVMVLTPEMEAQLRSIGVRTSIAVMPLWVDTEDLHPVADDHEGAAPTLLYSGNLGRKQGLVQIVDLAERLTSDGCSARILIRGAGGLHDELAEDIARRGIGSISFEPLVPRWRLNAALAAGQVHLVPQNPAAADFAIPSKIYNIMAVGRPFIATARPGSALWRLSEESGAFLCVPPNDAESLAAAAMALLNDPDRRRSLGGAGRAFVQAHNDRRKVLADFTQMAAVQSAAPQGVVILEPDKEGHPQEWLQHLVRFAGGRDRADMVWFVVAPELAEFLAAEVSPEQRTRIRVVSMTARERHYCTHRNLAVSGFARWWVMRRYLQRTGAEAGYFLSLDHLSLPLAFGLRARGRLGGILFRPSVHYRQLGHYAPSPFEWIRDARKGLLYRLMLLNGGVRSVLSLDPFFPDYAAVNYRSGDKVRTLLDPVYPHRLTQGRPQQIALTSERRTQFLLFGYLAERKGVLAVLRAITRLRPETAARTSFLFAGRVAPEIAEEVRNLIATLKESQPLVDIKLDDRRIPAVELAAMIEASDVILAPYQRFVGSSGVLLWASSFGKPVLTQDYGLLGRLVRDHRLGLATDVTDPARLASGIEEMLLCGPHQFIDPKSAASFAAVRTPEAFAEQVFRSV